MGSVEFIGGEDEDNVEVRAKAKFLSGGVAVRNVEFGGAVGQRGGGDVADCNDGKEVGEEGQGRKVNCLRNFTEADEANFKNLGGFRGV